MKPNRPAHGQPDAVGAEPTDEDLTRWRSQFAKDRKIDFGTVVTEDEKQNWTLLAEQDSSRISSARGYCSDWSNVVQSRSTGQMIPRCCDGHEIDANGDKINSGPCTYHSGLQGCRILPACRNKWPNECFICGVRIEANRGWLIGPRPWHFFCHEHFCEIEIGKRIDDPPFSLDEDEE